MNVDIFDSVERHGWVPVEWNANESLHALVDVLNLNTSYCEMVPAEQTTTLVAMCQDTARPGSKSALRGLTAFPPHTDGASKRKPPLLMMLRCLTAPSGCPTYLLSRHAIELEDSLRIGLSVGLGVPPKLIIFNGFLVGAGAQHCQGQIRQRDRFATTMTIPTRNGDFGVTRAGSKWPAPRAHSTACPNA